MSAACIGKGNSMALARQAAKGEQSQRCAIRSQCAVRSRTVTEAVSSSFIFVLLFGKLSNSSAREVYLFFSDPRKAKENKHLTIMGGLALRDSYKHAKGFAKYRADCGKTLQYQKYFTRRQSG